MLHSIGWQVDVYERTGDDLASRGAGIGTHDELFAVLGRIGITVDDSLGVVPLSRTCLDSAGKPVASIQRPRVLTSWARLYRALKDAFPDSAYHFGKNLSHFEDSGDSVVAYFADGTTAEADLLIGADGLRSTVRQQLFRDVQPRYAGYVAWRAPDSRSGYPREAAQGDIRSSDSLHARRAEHRGLSRARPGQRCAPGTPRLQHRLVLACRRGGGLRDLCTDASGRYYEGGIPPDMIRPELITSMRALAKKVLAPQFAELLELTPRIYFQAIYDLESPSMALGRIALLGDAAFVARPHCAMGVTKAGLDAESLADALNGSGDDIAAGLARYDEEQGEFGRRAVARARYLGAHLEAQHKPRELRTPAELSRDPEKWIRESGARLRDIPELLELVEARRRPSSLRQHSV